MSAELPQAPWCSVTAPLYPRAPLVTMTGLNTLSSQPSQLGSPLSYLISILRTAGQIPHYQPTSCLLVGDGRHVSRTGLGTCFYGSVLRLGATTLGLSLPKSTPAVSCCVCVCVCVSCYVLVCPVDLLAVCQFLPVWIYQFTCLPAMLLHICIPRTLWTVCVSVPVHLSVCPGSIRLSCWCLSVVGSFSYL